MAGIKVPGSDYVSSVSVPGSAPFQEASGAAFSVAQRTVAEGADKIEATGMLAQRHIQYAEAEKERQRQADLVLGKVNEATRRYGQLENDLKFGYHDQAENQYVPPVNSASYVPKLTEGADRINKDILDTVEDPNVKVAVSRGLKQLYESRLIQGQHFSTTLHVEEQQAADIAKGAETAQLAVRADNEIEQKKHIDSYLNYLDYKYGNSRPKYVAALKQKFTTEVKVAAMDHVSNSDPLKFQINYEKGMYNDVPIKDVDEAMARSKRKLEDAEKAKQKTHDEQKKMYEDEFVAPSANYGALPAEWLEEVRRGDHPLIPATDYPKWKNINDKALLNSAPAQQIRALRQKYATDPNGNDVATIKSYQRDLHSLVEKMDGATNPEIIKFGEHLQAMERAARNLNASEISAEVSKFRSYMKSQSKPGIDLNQIIKNSEKRLEGEGEKAIKGGAKAEDVIKRIEADKAKFRERLKTLPQSKIDDLGPMESED